MSIKGCCFYGQQRKKKICEQKELSLNFITLLTVPMSFGQALVISAFVPLEQSQFEIDLCETIYPDSVIGLHISVKFNENMIIRNSYEDGLWQKEEREENLIRINETCPLKPGKPITCLIFVGETKFHISFNEMPFCTFDFRTNNQKLYVVKLLGNITDVDTIDHRAVQPSIWPPFQKRDSSIGFSNDSPVRFLPGHCIILRATPVGNNEGQFSIIFYEGDSRREALNFTAFFAPYNEVVLNAQESSNRYGLMEKGCEFPFRIGEAFDLRITFTERKFLFECNAKTIAMFKYRTRFLLSILNGFKIKYLNFLSLNITELYHISPRHNKGEAYNENEFKHLCNYLKPENLCN